MPLPSGQCKIPIGNLHFNGDFVVKEYGESIPGGNIIIISHDVSSLPSGFYKFLTTINNGKEVEEKPIFSAQIIDKEMLMMQTFNSIILYAAGIFSNSRNAHQFRMDRCL